MRNCQLAILLLLVASPAVGQVPLRPVPQLAGPTTPSGEAPTPHRIVPLEGACLQETARTPNEQPAPELPDGEVYIEVEVSRPPALIKPGPRRYPKEMERSGIAGQVDFMFVIDTLGKAEPCSFRVLTATNSSFEVAAFRMVLGTLYRPGEVRGQKVRVLVTQSVTFNP